MKLKKLFYKAPNTTTKPLSIILNILLVLVFVSLVFWFSLSKIGVTFDFSFVSIYKNRIIDGFKMTISLSLLALLISLSIGIICAIAENSKILFFKYLAIGYVQFIRGTPLIMQIYLFYYIIGTAWGIENRFIAGALILSVFEGAYIAEIIRGSLLSISESQLEAARAVGFSTKQTITTVILPQLIERTLPALTGQFASIIKDSSLLSMIAVIELMQTMREISALNFKLFETYILLGLLYLCLTLPISLLGKFLERRFRYEN